MKIKQPKPFTFEAGPRAVLLLHGFTGHTADVRMLGRFLEKKGYTSHAPIYTGHGQAPEEILKSNPQQWWKDVQEALEHLKSLGYEEIAVAGLSLGGVFGLKLAYSTRIKAVIPMCTPMFFDNETQLTEGLASFSTEYKQLEKKEQTTIEKEVKAIMSKSDDIFNGIKETIEDVSKNIDTIYTPTFVVQAGKDEMINPESANYIYKHVETEEKEIKWYEDATHVITLDRVKDELHEDIFQFLEGLDWKV